MGPRLLQGFRNKPNTRRLALGVLVFAAPVLLYFVLFFERYPAGAIESKFERLILSGQNDDALRLAEDLSRHKPDSAVASYLRARALFALGRDRECDEALDHAAVQGYENALVDRLRGFLRLRQKRYSEAEPILVGAINRRSKIPDPELDEALARVFLQTYKMDLASQVLAKWRVDAPDDPRPYLWQTEVDRRTGAEPSLIEQHFREALAAIDEDFRA